MAEKPKGRNSSSASPAAVEPHPATGPAPEALHAVADVGRELAGPGELDFKLERALRVLDSRLSATRSVKWAAEHRRHKVARISSGALQALTDYAWPGNVRELENVIERAVVVCSGSVIHEHHLPDALVSDAANAAHLTLEEAVANLERRMIEDALHKSGGNQAAAARLLGTPERVVRYKALSASSSRERS